MVEHDPRAHIRARLLGTQPQRNRWSRDEVWEQLRPLVRRFPCRFHGYGRRGGLRDGSEGFAYQPMRGFWFQLLTDAKYREVRQERTFHASRAR